MFDLARVLRVDPLPPRAAQPADALPAGVLLRVTTAVPRVAHTPETAPRAVLAGTIVARVSLVGAVSTPHGAFRTPTETSVAVRSVPAPGPDSITNPGGCTWRSNG